MILRFWFVPAVVLIGAAGVCADSPRPSLANTRATIKKLWSSDPDQVAAAYKALEADPLAVPVLRRAIATDPEPAHRGVMERLLATRLKAQDAVLAKRIDQWTKDGRLDLLTEVRSLTDGPAAELALDGLLKSAGTLISVGRELIAPHSQRAAVVFRAGPPWKDGTAFAKDGPTPLFDVKVKELEKQTRQESAVFADRVTLPSVDLYRAVLVCRSHLDTLSTSPVYGGRSKWYESLVCVNSSLTLDSLSGSVVVVDGDVVLTSNRFFPVPDYSVLVANGDVTLAPNVAPPNGTASVIWATGDIDLPAKSGPYFSVWQAGGKVTNADELAKLGAVTQNVKEPPLPVRFLDPATDFGLSLEATKGGMKVAKLSERSPFADHLKVGDVITRVGVVPTTTAPAFRRELRRGVIEGAMLVDVVRETKKVELLLAVPDVPPAPKKAKPPEKK